MFKTFNNKKFLSLVLSLSTLLSYVPIANAEPTPFETKKKQVLENVKSAVSSPKFIVPTSIVGAISAVAITSHIYNTKFTKPRNPIENNIIGVTDERVNEAYDTHERIFSYSSDRSLEEKIDEILEEMNKRDCNTDFEKAVFLHDYICDHCKYPIVGPVIDRVTSFKTHFEPPHIYEAHGCLLNGKAVCAGIADAYSLLLTRAGVECKVVSGHWTVLGHDWNIVKINDHWYHVDVTWDSSHPAPHGRYKWFMLTEEEISQTNDITIKN